MREMGLLAPLRHEWLPDLDALEPQFRNPPWDPGLEWSVSYMHGTTGVVYQRDDPRDSQQDQGITRWADLWTQRLAGRITMLDDAVEVFGACLLLDGHSVNSGDPRELAAARERAVQQKPLVRAYLNAEVADQLVAGDVAAAQAWSVTAAQAMAEAPDRLAYALPVEGFARYCDSAAILRESGRAEAAHQFLNYLLRARVAADIALAMRTATCNAAARSLLPAEVRENGVLYPPAEVLERGEWFTPQSAASQRLRDRLWTEVKSA
jgi:spermidine/putrescine-binding protein